MESCCSAESCFVVESISSLLAVLSALHKQIPFMNVAQNKFAFHLVHYERSLQKQTYIKVVLHLLDVVENSRMLHFNIKGVQIGSS